MLSLVYPVSPALVMSHASPTEHDGTGPVDAEHTQPQQCGQYRETSSQDPSAAADVNRQLMGVPRVNLGGIDLIRGYPGHDRFGDRNPCRLGQVLGRGVSRLVTGDPWGQAVSAWTVGSLVSSVGVLSVVAARVSRERFMMSMPR